MNSFTERHASKIKGSLSCLDRVIITGTIPVICFPDGMASYLGSKKIRLFDYTKWAEPLREELREHAEKLARENELEIEFIRQNNFRKEQRVREIVAERGNHPGLVHIFSAMESCGSYRPWHDKKTGRTFLKHTQGKCLHYYFYFIDAQLGLCYLRVPTWAPFRLQFYYNGHNALAAQLQQRGIGFQMLDNAFVEIEDFKQAQKLADQIEPKRLQKRLDALAKYYCPVLRHFPSGYHWSLMQVEYATDIVFHHQQQLQPLYAESVRTAIHAVHADQVATFLGRKLTGHYQGELGNDFHTRIEGTRIKHHMGRAAIKMYDKHGIILRVETVANDVSFFKHHRRVEHRDGTWEMKVAPMKKTIYSMPALRKLLLASNHRYLEFLSTLEDPSSALRDLEKISKPTQDSARSYRGFNLFHGEDLTLFQVLLRGEFNISGFQNRDLQKHLSHMSGSQISRILKRLRKHGIIKKIGKRYKYYLTKLGQRVVAAALKLREMTIIPFLQSQAAA